MSHVTCTPFLSTNTNAVIAWTCLIANGDSFILATKARVVRMKPAARTTGVPAERGPLLGALSSLI